MRIDAIDNLSPAATLAQAPGGASRDFNTVLRRAHQKADEVHEAAKQLVSSAFVLPLLQQMREDPLRTELFHGGTAEDLFGQRLDTIIADRIVERANFPLVDAIYDRIIKHARPESELNTHG